MVVWMRGCVDDDGDGDGFSREVVEYKQGRIGLPETGGTAYVLVSLDWRSGYVYPVSSTQYPGV